MGCIPSKDFASVNPSPDHSGGIRGHNSGYASYSSRRNLTKNKYGDVVPDAAPNSSNSVSLRLTNFPKHLEGELVAAGWPVWLSAVAGEAIQGLVPLKSDSFEKLEKIGQGTYSTVFQARELETGKIVALKKIRFDNFDPESIRFMAREIQILRRLNHPNIIKLEGIITSRLSCSIYLVFEYMEHDLSGLSSSPDIHFTESQVKCYMRQLLSGLEHCHHHGIIHRDIKCSNLLINNEGILKIADFGLANFFNSSKNQLLTSRVVTLWYRPPELLLGSTDYGASVDLWSSGCVLAEVLMGKPILQGRTEVEQLHKIFKLCGSPPEEYWRKSKLPHATMFKPHQNYEKCIRDTCQGLRGCALGLVETLLSVEPYKRGTASSALKSKYFSTEPYACDPSSLPKYSPNKEIDARNREALNRKRDPHRAHGSRGSRPSRESNGSNRLPPHAEEMIDPQRNNNGSRLLFDLPPEPTVKPSDKLSHMKVNSQEDISFSGPLLIPSSSGFSWARSQRSNIRTDQSGARKTLDSESSNEMAKWAALKHLKRLKRPDSFDASEKFLQGEEERVEFSGPLLCRPQKVNDLLLKHERQIQHAVRQARDQRWQSEKQE